LGMSIGSGAGDSAGSGVIKLHVDETGLCDRRNIVKSDAADEVRGTSIRSHCRQISNRLVCI
jgi:hypothetical protein